MHVAIIVIAALYAPTGLMLVLISATSLIGDLSLSLSLSHFGWGLGYCHGDRLGWSIAAHHPDDPSSTCASQSLQLGLYWLTTIMVLQLVLSSHLASTLLFLDAILMHPPDMTLAAIVATSASTGLPRAALQFSQASLHSKVCSNAPQDVHQESRNLGIMGHWCTCGRQLSPMIVHVLSMACETRCDK